MKRGVFLAGEGRNELGGLADQCPYTGDEPGFLQAALEELVGVDRFEVRGAAQWKALRKYRTGAGLQGSPEVRNVQAAALQAKESGAQILVLVRDTDGSEARQ